VLIVFLSAERSRDASYLGKILEGFTLAQKPAEEKMVSSLRLSDLFLSLSG